MSQLYRIYIDYIERDQLYKMPHFMDQMFFADVRYIFVVESMWAVARLARKLPTVLLQERSTLTVIHLSTTECTWHIWDWCVHRWISPGLTWPQPWLVFKAERRCQLMVRVKHIPLGCTWDIQPYVSFSCTFQFTVVFTTMLVSTIPVSILGAHFAMGIDPFWSPEQYRQ